MDATGDSTPRNEDYHIFHSPLGEDNRALLPGSLWGLDTLAGWPSGEGVRRRRGCDAAGVLRPPTSGEGGAELPAPEPDGLVGDLHPTFRQQLRHVAVAEGEPEVPPDRVADDLGGKPVAPVQRVTGRHVRHAQMLRGDSAQLVSLC